MTTVPVSIPRPEYPRPDFDRSHRWLCLNGDWAFAPDPDDAGLTGGWQRPGVGPMTQTIHVPFAWESAASGIERLWLPVGWYRTTIRRPADWNGERTILNFGAVHYHAQFWIDGALIGEHTGGYTPFSFDVTDALTDGAGELTVRVEAPIDKFFIPHGKQKSLPADDYDGCSFTASSGIWQSVWLEGRPATYIQHVALAPTEALDGINVKVTLAGPNVAGSKLTLTVDGGPSVELTLTGETTVSATLNVNAPVLWSPENPRLYPVNVRLDSADGIDRVGTYTGLRKIEIRGGHFTLNGDRIYLRGALDQGYWPGSGYTAPDEAALRGDVELALEAGYNLIRKHIKLEDPRWHYWADRLGLLVWAEPPGVGRFDPEAISRFEAQLAPMVARDGNHPAIIMWGIYNEEWGLDWGVVGDAERTEALARAYDLLCREDSSRPIVDNSGWSHVKTDVADWHYYDFDMAGWKRTTSALAADRRVWYGFGIPGDWHDTRLYADGGVGQGQPVMNGEYGGGSPELQGWLFRWQTQDLRLHDDAFDGYIYTELYDVEYEHVGLYVADRTLKNLGCKPSDINADTLILFDLLPTRPGADVVSRNGLVNLVVRLSHHGKKPIEGTLSWGWQAAAPFGSAEVETLPFVLSAPTVIHTVLPLDFTVGKLHVWLTDKSGGQIAYNFVDVAAG